MLTVSISVNGVVVHARSALRVEDLEGASKYRTDAGVFVFHNPKRGIIPLAIKILETIEET